MDYTGRRALCTTFLLPTSAFSSRKRQFIPYPLYGSTRTPIFDSQDFPLKERARTEVNRKCAEKGERVIASGLFALEAIGAARESAAEGFSLVAIDDGLDRRLYVSLATCS